MSKIIIFYISCFVKKYFFSTTFERVGTMLGVTVKHTEIMTLPRILDIGRKNVYTLLTAISRLLRHMAFSEEAPTNG